LPDDTKVSSRRNHPPFSRLLVRPSGGCGRQFAFCTTWRCRK
jgi:hypothetical protein